MDEIYKDKVTSVYLLGSEGTIESEIYQKMLSKHKIECLVPSKDDYFKLRKCIEAVKQNKYSNDIKSIFIELVGRYRYCILGCTELPILYDKYKEDIIKNKVYDPLLITLLKLKKEYDNEKNNNIWGI